VRAEYSDGKAYVTPPPTFAHQEICQRLRDVIKTQLGRSVVVAVGVAWQLPGDRQRLRVPDLMVLADVPPSLVGEQLVNGGRVGKDVAQSRNIAKGCVGGDQGVSLRAEGSRCQHGVERSQPFTGAEQA
jgi:hypothetical protein